MTALSIFITIAAIAWAQAGLYGARMQHRAWVSVMHHDITYPWPWHYACALLGPLNIGVALMLRRMWRR